MKVTSRINQMLKEAVVAMEDKKAKDISVIYIGDISSIAEYFIICHGDNLSQIHAIVDNIDEKLGRLGFEHKKFEGYDMGNWVLMDYMDAVIHVFDEQSRSFYDLERIWRDGKYIDIANIV